MKKTTTFVSILFQVMLSVPRHNLALFREWVTIYTYSKASWGFAGLFFFSGLVLNSGALKFYF